MALFERLAAGIPVFAPSLDLLVEWHMRFGLVFERRADWQTAGQRRGSLVGPHPNASAALRDHDPNDERDPAAVRYWLGLSDIYTTPGVLLFNSWEHLLDLLREVDLCEVSRGLLEEQGTREEEVHSAWKEVLSEVVGGALPGGRPLPRGTFQDAMRELYPSLAL
ncbi:hypothetical protein T484DRAFT_3155859 [Baffinella frigidus]|nr:hypothetical protein T484DRAFT_3155859 [Cryptophyta sp. CCMP2293]